MEIRMECIELIREAVNAGARRAAACEILGLNLRTLERWERNPDQGDRRAGPHSLPANALTSEERKKIVELATSSQFRDLSPWQIVAKMADSGEYLASESSFYRVLKAENLLAHRSKSKPPTHAQPKDLVASKPNQIWSWDITYLKSQIRGEYYYLYMIMDIFSRMIVGWSVEEAESADHSGELIQRVCKDQGISRDQLTLHSDNGGPMKGATMLATLQSLGVAPSFSRPSVSDDNPFSESLFKTLKYRPSYPDGSFASKEEAIEWVLRFVTWYNCEHMHSGIKFVTPKTRHSGNDIALLQKRKEVYDEAKQNNPIRWSGPVRDWSRIETVSLNSRKEKRTKIEKLTIQAA